MTVLAVVIFWILIRAIGFSFDFSSLFSRDAQVEFADGDFIFAPLTSRDHRRGGEAPLVTWVEYSDFECSFCARFYPTTHEILEAYPYQVQLIYRHFPNTGSHEYSYEKAMATECAWDQGGDDAFWTYHDFLFESANASGIGVGYEDLFSVSELMGLDSDEFTECLENETFGYRVTEDMLTGMNAGVEGTPSSFVIGPDGAVQIVKGSIGFEDAKELIDAMLDDYAE